MKLEYIKCGDYYIPDLTLPEEPRPIGKWGPDALGVSEGTSSHPIQHSGSFL